mgnify:CR=1 FL=1
MLGKGYVWARGRSNDGQVIVWNSGDSQVMVKSQKHFELDIGGHETFKFFFKIKKFLKILQTVVLNVGSALRQDQNVPVENVLRKFGISLLLLFLAPTRSSNVRSFVCSSVHPFSLFLSFSRASSLKMRLLKYLGCLWSNLQLSPNSQCPLSKFLGPWCLFWHLFLFSHSSRRQISFSWIFTSHFWFHSSYLIQNAGPVLIPFNSTITSYQCHKPSQGCSAAPGLGVHTKQKMKLDLSLTGI